MRPLRKLFRDRNASAAAEMAMVTPFLLALIFGSMELGNFFLQQHAVTKSVRDGARYASRLTLSETYSCPSAVFDDANYEQHIKNVTKTGTVDGSGDGRFSPIFWGRDCTGGTALAVSIRCVPKGTYQGIYTGLADYIPAVKVTANVRYQSVLSTLGFDTTGLCLKAESEAAVTGL